MRHVETHIEGLSYTCLLCDQETKTKGTMKVHIAQHKQLSQVSYTESRNASDTGNLNKEEIKEDDEPFICSMEKDDVLSMVLTMIAKQEEMGSHRKMFKCNVCDKVSEGKGDCMKHAEQHIDGLSYTCIQCEHITKTKTSMKVHILKHEENGINDIINIASVVNTETDPLVENISWDNLHKDETEEEVKLYTCSMDKNEVRSKSLTMIAKLEEIGSHGRMFKCNVCSLVSRDKGDCMKHVELHINGLTYTCFQCEHTTKTKTSIKVHVLKHEGIIKNSIAYISDITSLVNVDKDKLEEQISSMIVKGEKHTNGKQRGNKWACTICGKISMQRNHSVAHVETHLEGLLYSCPQCSFTGKTRVAIRLHLKVAH